MDLYHRSEISTAPGSRNDDNPHSVRRDDPDKFSAAEQLARVVEIIEMIFSHADLRTLLVSLQRTCVLWRDIIASSPLIQERLYFRLPPPHKRPQLTAQGDKEEDDTGLDIPAPEINPLLLETFGHPGEVWDSYFNGYSPYRRDVCPPNEREWKDKAIRCAGASWRRMLVGHDTSGNRPCIAFSKEIYSPTTYGERMLLERKTHIYEFEDTEQGWWRMGDLWDIMYGARFLGPELQLKQHLNDPNIYILADLGSRSRWRHMHMARGAKIIPEYFPEGHEKVGVWIYKSVESKKRSSEEWLKEKWMFVCDDFDAARWQVDGVDIL